MTIKQKIGREVKQDQKRFSRTAKRTKKINISPRIPRGGIRL